VIGKIEWYSLADIQSNKEEEKSEDSALRYHSSYLRSAPTPALYCALLRPGNIFQMSSGLLLSPTASSPSELASSAANNLLNGTVGVG
jgi:hypothetical protein